jgi:hypothetical protein
VPDLNIPGGYIYIMNASSVDSDAMGGGSGQQCYGMISVVPGDIVYLETGLGGYFKKFPRYSSIRYEYAKTNLFVNKNYSEGDYVRFLDTKESFICKSLTNLSPYYDPYNCWSRASPICDAGTAYGIGSWNGLDRIAGGDTLLSVTSRTKRIVTVVKARGAFESLGGTLFPQIYNPIGTFPVVDGSSITGNYTVDGYAGTRTSGAPSAFSFTDEINGRGSGAGGNGLSSSDMKTRLDVLNENTFNYKIVYDQVSVINTRDITNGTNGYALLLLS